ncbi:MAG: helicase-related protein [Gemmatimonadaceae bacterium]
MIKVNFDRPDVEKILGTLKDFQRATVEHAFQRLYVDDPCAHRLLIADEVGLGKTMVARGLIARAIDRLWDSVDRIDIVYVCSNADIARQNVNRMNITGRRDFGIASRITMLPLEVNELQKRPLNFVSFTPSTSFDLKSAGGRVDERALLYFLIKRAWGCEGTGPKNLMQGYAGTERFRQYLKGFEEDRIDESLAAAFKADLKRAATNDPGLRDRFDDLCQRFRYDRSVPAADRRQQNALIGELRGILARTCIESLQPDIVILDEFQRFKHLLTGESEAAQLAKALFNYSDSQGRARVVLLSATPYKMYTLSDENDTDDHYADFLLTLRFLQQDEAVTARVDELLREFRRMLTMIGVHDRARVIALKGEIEALLRKVVVRTEKLSATADRSGMLKEHSPRDLRVEARDLLSYRRMQVIARLLEREETLEYWKSAPFLLNFMDHYQLKAAFKTAVENAPDILLPACVNSGETFLARGVLHRAAPLDPPHTRLRWLMERVMGGNEFMLLWVPPSLPYHRLAEHFEAARTKGLTKHLLFSVWKVVPKTIAALVSYEAERRILSPDDPKTSLSDARLNTVGMLRFARSEDRLVGMPLLTLLYPSVVLARAGDPLGEAGNGDAHLSVEALVESVERRIVSLLEPLIIERANSSRVPDEAWYWAAPLLLDDREGLAQEWLNRPSVSSLWRYGPTRDVDSADEDDGSAWSEHVARSREVLNKREKLGTPPADLARVIALVAIASPAVTALRALVRGTSEAIVDPAVRDAAGSIAFGFRSLFNLPEATAIVRSFHPGEPYWLRVLEYAAGGGLQAVLDEYFHVLRESEGLSGSDAASAASGIAKVAVRALELRTAAVGVDEIRINEARGRITIEPRRMRAHFAARFGGEEEAEVGKTRTRSDHVREAFNSPFWPFVLASTSVGQEGLDFHQYCHAVVHWNLPANPVDLEQREGRVHRYKGHAVRKNLATHLGMVATLGGDPWSELFAAAKRARRSGATDLFPFWIYPIENGARIERHVPMLPLSKEIEKLSALKRALAVYRMVFGQPRQEELVEFLQRNVPEDQIPNLMQELRIDLSPEMRTSQE